MLSLKVRDIVFKEKKSSYKEVAEILIKLLKKSSTIPFNVKIDIFAFTYLIVKRRVKY